MLFQRPLVMPMVNIIKKLYSPVFSTTTPCSAKNLVTTLAGMPVAENLPLRSMPGVTIVDLIGSSMLKPAAIFPNPCQFTPALALGDSPLMIQLSARPIPSSMVISGPHTLNHQSSPYSSSTLRMARRKSSASAMLSSTKAVPPGGSIMAAATSQLAMMLYCGDVLVCIK